MEDLWRVKKSGVDLKDYAEYVEYKRFLKRFKDEEEQANRRHLLFGESIDQGARTGKEESR